MKLLKSFPTPLFHHRVPSNIANQVENLVNSKIHLLEKNGENQKTDFFSEKIISLEEINELKQEIDKCIRFYCNNVKIDIPTLKSYWVQDYSKEEFHERHTHGRCDLAIVYWIRANNNAGHLKLYNQSPLNKIFYPSKSGKSEYTTDEIYIEPLKGGLVIFPGYIEHEVLSGEKNCIRTTLALNYINKELVS